MSKYFGSGGLIGLDVKPRRFTNKWSKNRFTGHYPYRLPSTLVILILVLSILLLTQGKW